MADPPPDLAAYFGDLRQRVEAALARALDLAAAPPLVVDVMRYAALGGGKRLRPCLTLATADAVAPAAGVTTAIAQNLALPAACAIELVHTYSLVHDDLPAMDDDTLRRGRATAHVVYGDGLAILAGDGLLTEAFALLSEDPSRVAAAPAPPAAARLRAIAVLADAAGAIGMVGGQAIDLAAAGRVPAAFARPAPLDRAALADMHARKTGALIRAAVTMGAIVTAAPAAAIAAAGAYAQDVGLAFQIIDDVLDVEGSNDQLGKTAGKDARAGKPTYPSLYGVDASRRMAAECVARAKAALETAGLHGRLGDIADWSLGRRA